MNGAQKKIEYEQNDFNIFVAYIKKVLALCENFFLEDNLFYFPKSK